MFVVRILLLPVQVGYAVGRVASRISYRVSRVLGLRRLVLIGAGLAIGVAATPVTGAQARARLAGFVRRPAPVPDAELADRVRFELSHASTTWHLAQPGVSVVGGVVTLSGRAPQHGARADLERVAATVPGVARVDNHMELAGSPS